MLLNINRLLWVAVLNGNNRLILNFMNQNPKSELHPEYRDYACYYREQILAEFQEVYPIAAYIHKKAHDLNNKLTVITIALELSSLKKPINIRNTKKTEKNLLSAIAQNITNLNQKCLEICREADQIHNSVSKNQEPPERVELIIGDILSLTGRMDAIKNQFLQIKNILNDIGEADGLTGNSYFQEIQKTVEESINICQQTEPIYKSVDIGKIILSCENRLRQLAEKNNPDVKFTCEMGKAKEALVLADPNMLRRILENLVKNSAEAIRAKMIQAKNSEAKIAISLEFTERDGKHFCVISIRDTGIGFGNEAIQKILQGESGPGVTTKETSGIGIAEAKKYINSIGGQLIIKNIEENGAEVSIILLINQSNNPKEPAKN